MRRRGRVDANHGDIVRALRTAGMSVQSLANIGSGCPDILIGDPRTRTNLLAEIKDGSKPPSQRRLTADEQKWHDEWRGQVAVVESVEDALRLVGRLR